VTPTQRARLLALAEELTGEDNYGDLAIRSAPGPLCADWAKDVRDMVAALDRVRALCDETDRNAVVVEHPGDVDVIITRAGFSREVSTAAVRAAIDGSE